MSFELLKEVIAYLKKTSHCPTCKTSFGDDDIFVLATLASPCTDSCYGMFAVSCPKCESEGCMLIEAGDNRPYETLTSLDSTEVSVDEVLDMRNFLKKWKGDVKELFTE